MAEQLHLDWFRVRLAASQPIESKDPSPLLAWREERLREISFKAELIGLDEVRRWRRDERGNLHHETGQFFSIEGVRVESGGLREVLFWEQPIYTQLTGGILAMIARELPDQGVTFLLQAKVQPGNIGVIQYAPSIQSTWSNIKRAHGGKAPPLVEVLMAPAGVRIVYRAKHNEEGGPFWQKSNENIILFVDDDKVIGPDLTMFRWASLSQIKQLALMDNLLSPFVKTVLAPL